MLPIVISGGKGTRLWPYSRTSFPKPFCNFFDESLMEKTLKRLSHLGAPGVVSVEEQKVLTQITFRSLNITSSLSIFEPFGRNTAASVALVCHVLIQQNRKNEVVGIFPADQLIQEPENFLAAVRLAEKRASEGAIVTVGVKPTFPATGFGYIEVSQKPDLFPQYILAKKFHEKPNLETAARYVDSGRYFWNAGIFIFNVRTLAQLFAEKAPKLWQQIQSILPDLSNVASVYSQIDPISFDYAIMEKLENKFECIPCDMGWSDVGSWSEIKKIAKSQPVFEQDAKGTVAYSMNAKKTFAAVGVDDLIIVDTADALLVTKSESAQQVGPLVSKIEKVNEMVTTEHQFDLRPWGDYEVLEDGEHFKVKTIRVKPGQQLSYQSHTKRAEHWIVVRGEAIVTIDEREVSMRAGDHVFIPIGAKHRIRNSSAKPVEFVEVQTGSYFGEDDIVRYTDDYGRT